MCDNVKRLTIAFLDALADRETLAFGDTATFEAGIGIEQGIHPGHDRFPNFVVTGTPCLSHLDLLSGDRESFHIAHNLDVGRVLITFIKRLYEEQDIFIQDIQLQIDSALVCRVLGFGAQCRGHALGEILTDLRNGFEYGIGSLTGACDIRTRLLLTVYYGFEITAEATESHIKRLAVIEQRRPDQIGIGNFTYQAS
jgi:hypothetical protein